MSTIQGRAGNGEVVATMVRLPRDLRDALKEQAQGLGRSLNTHIVMTMGEKVGGRLKDQGQEAAQKE